MSPIAEWRRARGAGLAARSTPSTERGSIARSTIESNARRGWSRSRRSKWARFASTRRSTWSLRAWALRARRRLWQRARQELTSWRSNAAWGDPEGLPPIRAASSTWEAVRPSRALVAFGTRPRTWPRSYAPLSDQAWTTNVWTCTARVRRTTSTGWSLSACLSGRPSATNRIGSRPMTQGCFSAAVRTPTHLTRLRSRSRVATNRSTSIPPGASSWIAWVLLCRPAVLVWWPMPGPSRWSPTARTSSA